IDFDRAISISVVVVSLTELLLPVLPNSRHVLLLLSSHTGESIQNIIVVTLFEKSIGLVQGCVRRRNPGFGKAHVAIVVRAALAPHMVAAVVENQTATIPIVGIVHTAEPRVKKLPAYVVERLVIERAVVG